MAMRNPYAAYQRYAVNTPKPQPETTENTVVQKQVADVPQTSTHKLNTFTGYPNKGASQYLENTVLTAAPEELTLMLYDGAIKFMNQAVVYIDMQNYEKSNTAIIRAQNIFEEFMNTLNMDYEVSKYLYSLYDYINFNLVQANIKKDVNLIREMIDFTRELRDTWAEAMKIAKKG